MGGPGHPRGPGAGACLELLLQGGGGGDKLLWVIEATCASLLRLAHIPRLPLWSPISTLLLHRPICSRHVKSLTFTTLIKSHLLQSKCSQRCWDNQTEFQPLDGDNHSAGMSFVVVVVT